VSYYPLILLFISLVFSQHRAIYSVGDTVSYEDQNLEFNVCHSDGNYEIGEGFSLSNYNGEVNGGDYKISLISMNATW